MPTYPEVITDEVLNKHSAVPNEQILQDIRDTMTEIEVLKKRVQDRERFIVFLNQLLTARKKSANS